MNPDAPKTQRAGHPAGENIRALRQGISLIERLAASLYIYPPGGVATSGAGGHFRHCIEFYTCFLQGLETGRVDYGSRRREARLEIDRGYAIETMEAIATALAGLDPASMSRGLLVSQDACAGSGADWCVSSVGRELQFLASHTTHHLALILMLLRIQGFEPDGDLADAGVSPSTLRYRERTRRLSG